jgi:anti-sigma factor RsiW
MNVALPRKYSLVQYLLGDLPSEAREELEERLFTEPGLGEELHAAADDLIHAYLAGELSRLDRRRFESYFLDTPRHRERFAFVRDLVSAVERASPRPRASWRPMALAAAVLLATLLVGWRLLPSRGQARHAESTPSAETRRAPSPHDAAPSPAARDTTTTKTPAPRHSDAPPQVVRLPEVPATQPVEIALSAGTRLVRFEVPVEEAGPPSYEAILRHTNGAQLWRATGLAPASSGEPVVLDVPVRVVAAAADAYELVLEGEPVRGRPVTRKQLRFELRIRWRPHTPAS